MARPAEIDKVNIDDVNTIDSEFRILQACISGASNCQDVDENVRAGIELEMQRFDNLLYEFIKKVSDLIRCSKT